MMQKIYIEDDQYTLIPQHTFLTSSTSSALVAGTSSAHGSPSSKKIIPTRVRKEFSFSNISTIASEWSAETAISKFDLLSKRTLATSNHLTTLPSSRGINAVSESTKHPSSIKVKPIPIQQMLNNNNNYKHSGTTSLQTSAAMPNSSRSSSVQHSQRSSPQRTERLLAPLTIPDSNSLSLFQKITNLPNATTSKTDLAFSSPRVPINTTTTNGSLHNLNTPSSNRRVPSIPSFSRPQSTQRTKRKFHSQPRSSSNPRINSIQETLESNENIHINDNNNNNNSNNSHNNSNNSRFIIKQKEQQQQQLLPNPNYMRLIFNESKRTMISSTFIDYLDKLPPPPPLNGLEIIKEINKNPHSHRTTTSPPAAPTSTLISKVPTTNQQQPSINEQTNLIQSLIHIPSVSHIENKRRINLNISQEESSIQEETAIASKLPQMLRISQQPQSSAGTGVTLKSKNKSQPLKSQLNKSESIAVAAASPAILTATRPVQPSPRTAHKVFEQLASPIVRGEKNRKNSEGISSHPLSNSIESSFAGKSNQQQQQQQPKPIFEQISMLNLPVKVSESLIDFDEIQMRSDKRPRKSTFGVSERNITWKESPRVEIEANTPIEGQVQGQQTQGQAISKKKQGQEQLSSIEINNANGQQSQAFAMQFAKKLLGAAQIQKFRGQNPEKRTWKVKAGNRVTEIVQAALIRLSRTVQEMSSLPKIFHTKAFNLLHDLWSRHKELRDTFLDLSEMTFKTGLSSQYYSIMDVFQPEKLMKVTYVDDIPKDKVNDLAWMLENLLLKDMNIFNLILEEFVIKAQQGLLVNITESIINQQEVIAGIEGKMFSGQLPVLVNSSAIFKDEYRERIKPIIERGAFFQDKDATRFDSNSERIESAEKKFGKFDCIRLNSKQIGVFIQKMYSNIRKSKATLSM